MNLKTLIIPLLALMPAVAAADTVDEAVAAAKAAPRNRALSRAAGDALKEAGRYGEAMKYYLQSDNAGNLGAAECAFYLYDFSRASELLDKYLAKRTKAEAAKDLDFTYRPDAEPSDWTDYLRERISLGESMLDRVEKIQVIDSINVPAESFFEYMRLAKSSGRVLGEENVRNFVTDETLDRLGLSDVTGTGFMTENGDDIIWTATDPYGNPRIYETTRLADGKWDTPTLLFGYESIFGNTNGSWVSAPFLMSDGVTMYFAADGEESLGGLDIFISRRDGDRFLQPSNIGMPYNSPFNDYMYAIDEETGTGWWVTDRNGLTDSVTVYTFIPQELRINYPVDTPDLTSYARVASIASTIEPDADHSRLLRKIANLGQRGNASAREEEFEFALPDGKIVRRMADLRTPMARRAMQEYLNARKEIDSLKANMAKMRLKYANGDDSYRHEIIQLEDKIETLSGHLLELSNNVVTAEN
ncbi:MAG: hypothetical protein NC339_06020 [Muribaculaceae bacterium]|nr:hypothetical protein [Muribaculaceae bacterium]